MKKIILISSFAVVMLLQIFIMGQFFFNRYNIIFNGDKFRMLVSDLDLTGARDDGYIEVELKKRIGGLGKYGIINIDENEFAELSKVALEKPNFGAYIASSIDNYFYFPIEKYYIDNSIEYDKDLTITENSNIYLVVIIKDGKIEPIDLLIDGNKVEKYIR